MKRSPFELTVGDTLIKVRICGEKVQRLKKVLFRGPEKVQMHERNPIFCFVLHKRSKISSVWLRNGPKFSTFAAKWVQNVEKRGF